MNGETKSAIFGKGKCELTAIVQIFGMGKCKLTANFSTTMMTSLSSISLSLSVSLSLSHRAYLTHNIGSASALPIIQVESKYKDIRHATLETGGRESAKTGWAGGQAGQHKLSSLGQGPTMSPGSHGRAVI